MYRFPTHSGSSSLLINGATHNGCPCIPLRLTGLSPQAFPGYRVAVSARPALTPMPDELLASDGLRARDNGPWGRDKLSFIDSFGPPALQATKRKTHRVYVDLFAGPGRNIVRGSRRGEEYTGSPIRALQMRATNGITFTHAYLVNAIRADHVALEERVARMYAAGEAVIPRQNVRLIQGDANAVIDVIFRQIHTLAYVFVFADIEAPRHWPWSSVEALTRRGHESVDLYSLFPLDMAIVRLMSYEEGGNTRYAQRLTAYFGTDAWRSLLERRVTNERAAELRQALVQLYVERLKTRWRDAGPVKDVYLRGQQFLYRMLFASNNPAGARIAKWASGLGGTGQMDLF